MIELLRAAAADHPDVVAVQTPDRAVTWAQLLHAAEQAATGLLARGITRVAILHPDPADVWALLAGGSLAGVETCVYPLASDDEVVVRLRARLEHEVIITSREVSGDGVLTVTDVLSGEPDAPAEPPAQRPLLILTSGTSGEPKAARHQWPLLLAPFRNVVPTPDHRWLLAYAVNQFGGVQILLHVASARATLVSGESFQPRDALVAMRRHDVTHASGTPTFWRFVLAEMRADGEAVPALEQVTLGGEAVSANLLGQLRAAFHDAKISQLYGSTESGRMISVRDGLPGMPLSALTELDGIEFRVVDGELEVRSATSMSGYYGQETVTTDGWRQTGDLVEVTGDRILFQGRRSEVINVGGVKIHPLPVEERVGDVPGVALVRALARPNPLVGNIVAVEVVLEPGSDEDVVRAAIRDACATLPSAARPRSITFVPTLQTGGNKLTRRSAP